MASRTLLFLIVIFLLSDDSSTVSSAADNNGGLQTYIVHVHHPSGSAEHLHPSDRERWHRAYLPAGEDRLLYSYRHAVSGFAALLSEDELEAMRSTEGFVHAVPDRVLALQTTYSHAFLGLNRQDPSGAWSKTNFGRGVIIGVLDTGISPRHPSFADEGMPPPPPKWKGRCDFGTPLCNNKLIGARTFDLGHRANQSTTSNSTTPGTPPYDDNGHGTHTASTAAGRFLDNISILGNANGTASGIAPLAHLAIYKVCFPGEQCPYSDILAGIDSAIDDGVDVMSMSFGGTAIPLYNDTMAIASFRAMEKGIFVSCAAGNEGPGEKTVENGAPWILTVSAGTMNRTMRAVVKLGNGVEFDGESLYQPTNFSSNLLLPLVYPGNMNTSNPNATYCYNNSLDSVDVKGKIVLCDYGLNRNVEKGEVVKKAGGAGMIIANPRYYGYDVDAGAHVLPASHVGFGLDNITAYLSSTSNPTATIYFKGTLYGTMAPDVASFSSRGPYLSSPGILKPDVMGPGVNILAAWSTGAPPFRMISGTSMATPHLSRVAALIKSAHPDWSPAMIKSAIMTTANPFNNLGSWIVDDYDFSVSRWYATGAGNVDPVRAINPGLVYDIGADDYISYLCGLGFTDAKVGVIAHRPVRCSEYKKIDGPQLNFPSFVLEVGIYKTLSIEVNRTVTNVGLPSSVYDVRVILSPSWVTMVVKPERLSFTQVGEKKDYSVTFTLNSTTIDRQYKFNSGVTEGYLKWVSSDGEISVASPIVITLH